MGGIHDYYVNGWTAFPDNFYLLFTYKIKPAISTSWNGSFYEKQMFHII